jgi:putative hydrolase of the HAD superfamily
MIKLLTFDLDDTLWPADGVIEKAIAATVSWVDEHYPVVNERVSQSEFVAIRNRLIAEVPAIKADLTELRIRTFEAAAVQAGMDRDRAIHFARRAFDVFIAARNKVELFPGAREVLSELRREFRLIALSNGNSDLKAIGIDHYFEAHFQPVDAGQPKPEAAMFELALKTAKVTAGESIHIGDDLVCDIEGANALGFKTIFVNILNRPSPESEALADATVTSLPELHGAIQGLSRCGRRASGTV